MIFNRLVRKWSHRLTKLSISLETCFIRKLSIWRNFYMIFRRISGSNPELGSDEKVVMDGKLTTFLESTFILPSYFWTYLLIYGSIWCKSYSIRKLRFRRYFPLICRRIHYTCHTCRWKSWNEILADVLTENNMYKQKYVQNPITSYHKYIHLRYLWIWAAQSRVTAIWMVLAVAVLKKAEFEKSSSTTKNLYTYGQS